MKSRCTTGSSFAKCAHAYSIYKMTQQVKYYVYVDGASQGNPGESGIGAIICKGDDTIKNISQYIGITTNNVAEYVALIYGLQEALIQNIRNININTDSELLYRQLKGEYKVKDSTLKIFNAIAKHLLGGFEKSEINHISREENKGADKLATLAIEKRPVLLKGKRKSRQARMTNC